MDICRSFRRDLRRIFGRPQHRFRHAVAITLLLTGTGAPAAPFVPADDAQVLERLPVLPAGQFRELTSLQAAAARAPNDLVSATALATAYYRASRLEGDPRFLGYAQAALSAWWKDPQAPTEVLLLRATILQSSHAFETAVADLDRVLQRAPANPQAWLTRATILSVEGRFPEARENCGHLLGLARDVYRTICVAAIDSMTGSARSAYDTLRSTLIAPSRLEASGRLWGETLLGEIAHRLADPRAGEHFRRALTIDGQDIYGLGAYSDWLLDQNRPADVVALLQGVARADTLLLRLALAQHALKLPEASASIDMLRARFDASHARGDTVHDRENARFELFLRRDAKAALGYAVANWKVQREAADLRILAEAGLAAGDADAVAVAKQWLTGTGIEFPAVAAMIESRGWQ